MERLPRIKKYLEAIFNSYATLEDGHHLPQRPPGEANSIISTLRLRLIYDKVNSLAFHEPETKVSSKKHYKMYQVRWQV